MQFIFSEFKSLIFLLITVLVIGQEENHPTFEVENESTKLKTVENTILENKGYTSGFHLANAGSCPNANTALKADHQLFPNPSLAYAVGASVGNTLSDVGLSSTKYPITAGSGVKYNGHSLTFDGTSNAWVSFGNAVSFGGEAFSISVRAKYTSFSQVWSRVFDFQPSASNAGVLLGHQSTVATVGVNAFDTLNVGSKYPSTWTLNQFGHVLFTCTPPDTCKFYFNGALAATYTLSMTTQTYSHTAGLGKSSYSNDGYFAGEIADFRLFSRALTSDEVTAIYTGNECATSSCSAGNYYSTTSSSCVACPAFSTSNSGAYTCTCAADFYQTGYGVGLICKACKTGSISNAGAYTCTCQNGFISNGYGAGLICHLSLEFVNNITANIRSEFNNQIANITLNNRDEFNNQIANITLNNRNEINQITNITSDIRNEISNIKNEIAKINTLNQKLSATLTKLRKTTHRKKKIEL